MHNEIDSEINGYTRSYYFSLFADLEKEQQSALPRAKGRLYNMQENKICLNASTRLPNRQHSVAKRRCHVSCLDTHSSLETSSHQTSAKTAAKAAPASLPLRRAGIWQSRRGSRRIPSPVGLVPPAQKHSATLQHSPDNTYLTRCALDHTD